MIDFLYSQNFINFMFIIIKIIALVVPLLVIVAFLTYAERKVIASVQLRKGPNVVGPFGLLQPLADGLKLFSKLRWEEFPKNFIRKGFKMISSYEINKKGTKYYYLLKN